LTDCSNINKNALQLAERQILAIGGHVFPVDVLNSHQVLYSGRLWHYPARPDWAFAES
jgi:hypothetical protein